MIKLICPTCHSEESTAAEWKENVFMLTCQKCGKGSYKSIDTVGLVVENFGEWIEFVPDVDPETGEPVEETAEAEAEPQE